MTWLGAKFAIQSDTKISSSGRSDLERHIGTLKHANRLKAKQTPTITSMFSSKRETDTLNKNTGKAELLFTSFLLEHNLPLSHG